MHTEQDTATYYATMSRLTGHSRRYLIVRGWVRAALAICATVIPFTFALTK